MDFDKLPVYRLAEKLADQLWDIVSDWEVYARTTVGEPLLRAADNIGANIADGSGRGSYHDNRRSLKQAKGALYQTKHWLRRAYNRRLLTQEQVDTLKTLLDELAPRLNAHLKSISDQIPERPFNNADKPAP
jgi:four helix bundle protein